MNPARVTDRDDLPWLIAAQRVYTCTQAAPCAPDAVQEQAPAAGVRLLPATRWVPPPDTSALWHAVTPYVQRATGLRSLDDPTLHKPYARTRDVRTRHGRGTQHHVDAGSNRLTLVWTAGALTVPGAWRVYHPPLPNRHPKQDPVRAMLATAKQRDVAPRYGCVDRWYSSRDNLQAVRPYEWHGVPRLKPNRLVPPLDRATSRCPRVRFPRRVGKSISTALASCWYVGLLRQTATRPPGPPTTCPCGRLPATRSRCKQGRLKAISAVSTTAAEGNVPKSGAHRRSRTIWSLPSAPVCAGTCTASLLAAGGMVPSSGACVRHSVPLVPSHLFASRQLRNS